MPDPSLPPDWMIREYLDRSRTLLDSIFATPEQLAREDETRVLREIEQAEAQEEARIREVAGARWTRQIRRWASKHPRTA